MATIKGTVTRLDTNGSNFYMKPLPEYELPLRHVDVDGHRVGVDELSARCLNAAKAKFKPWQHDLPKIGDEVELEFVRDPE